MKGTRETFGVKSLSHVDSLFHVKQHHAIKDSFGEPISPIKQWISYEYCSMLPLALHHWKAAVGILQNWLSVINLSKDHIQQIV